MRRLIPVIRYFRKNKLTTIINTVGLSIGFTVFLLMTMFIKFETGYDQENPDANITYRLLCKTIPLEGEPWIGRTTVPPLAVVLKNNYPEIDKIARLFRLDEQLFRYEDIYFEETNAYYAEQDIVDLLNLQFINGNDLIALSAPYSVILSNSTAKKYFGDNDAMGKSLRLGNRSFLVTGIYKDVKKNNHLIPDILLSYNSPGFWIYDNHKNDWDLFFVTTYLKLKPGTSVGKLNLEISRILNDHKPKEDHTINIIGKLEKLPDLHLKTETNERSKGDIRVIKMLKGMSVFILIIVLINYINISTAQVMERCSQVSIKKVVGISRMQLILNFISESAIIHFVSVVISLAVTVSMLPYFNNWFDIDARLFMFSNQEYLLGLFIILISIGISVFYPLSIMSSFNPAETLKGKFLSSLKSLNTRKALIAFQYLISFVLIFGTVILYKQSQLLLNKDLGINTSGIIVIKTNNISADFSEKKETLKKELEKIPELVSVTNSNALPGKYSFLDAISSADNRTESKSHHSIIETDKDFIHTMGVKLIAGRNFDANSTANNSVILTEKSIKELGLGSHEEAIGKKVIREYFNSEYKIIGVVEDFKLSNIDNKAFPFFIVNNNNQNRYLALKYSTSNYLSVTKQVKDTWQNIYGDIPMRYFFLNDQYTYIYKKELFTTNIVLAFCILSIFLASLGLFGLTYFIIIKREKEFGIRKVNGAALSDIFFLVIKGFTALILISSIIAFPVSMWLSEKWLSNYTTRIVVELWIFIIPVIILSTITFFTISYHSLKSSSVNPVNVLKNE